MQNQITQQIDRRDYGRLEAQVSQLTNDVHALKQTVEAMKEMMTEARGGWKTILMLAGVAASVGAFITWIASHVRLT